jgi:TIR domain
MMDVTQLAQQVGLVILVAAGYIIYIFALFRSEKPQDSLIKQWTEWYKSRKESGIHSNSQQGDHGLARDPDKSEWKRTIDPVAERECAGIFISYRRQDEPNFAGRLYDRLVAHFGKDNVFMDVDSIELGLDFVDVINQSLSYCKVLIVVIGKNWLKIADNQGQVRLKDPHDYVRLEIETGLNRNIRVIPVLVEGASTPKNEELPSSMALLARRNGVAMSHAHFAPQADDLIDRLKRIFELPD